MPSPFPGMDPYLENPAAWPGLHHRLISEIQEALNERLRPRYRARIEERVYISDDGDLGRPFVIPDVLVAASGMRRRRPQEPGGGVAVEMEVGPDGPVVTMTMIEEEIHEARLEIVDVRSREVVAVIEVLSPSNKVAGSKGWESFVQKRREVGRSTSHWIEIDLLRKGRSLEARGQIRPHEYMVHVSRADRRPDGMIWPIRLSRPLPIVPIPLRPGDDDVPLDLQAVFDTAYDRAGYDLDVDYRNNPDPPLEDPWADWADRLLKEKGLRPGSD